MTRFSNDVLNEHNIRNRGCMRVGHFFWGGGEVVATGEIMKAWHSYGCAGFFCEIAGDFHFEQDTPPFSKGPYQLPL